MDRINQPPWSHRYFFSGTRPRIVSLLLFPLRSARARRARTLQRTGTGDDPPSASPSKTGAVNTSTVPDSQLRLILMYHHRVSLPVALHSWNEICVVCWRRNVWPLSLPARDLISRRLPRKFWALLGEQITQTRCRSTQWIIRIKKTPDDPPTGFVWRRSAVCAGRG